MIVINCDQVADEVAEALTASGALPVRVFGMSVAVSADFDDYAAGRITSPRCVLCGGRPCQCPPFGSDEYFALIDKVHGKRGN